MSKIDDLRRSARERRANPVKPAKESEPKEESKKDELKKEVKNKPKENAKKKK